ncbi:MAG: hypothetical protein ABII07_01155 [Patescibacteria group bacterium]|nr:hypothetical protein [Patescibacteria group bacterium]
MKTKTLHAAVITKEDNKFLLSIKGENGEVGSLYWPSHTLPENLTPGDEFAITLSEENPQKNTDKPSEETLRTLLYELIN